MLSAIVGANPPRDSGDVDIELGVGSILRLFKQNENVEAWRCLKSAQCYELGDCLDHCFTGFNLDLNELDDEQLQKAAMKMKRFNQDLANIELDYMGQLRNLEFIDRMLEERNLVREKQIACFKAQVRLTIKMHKLNNGDHKDGNRSAKLGGRSANPPMTSAGLNTVPINVRYEAGTHIELDLIGASIFMPWKWLRVKELYPKNASVCVFADGFAGDLKYVFQICNTPFA